MPVKVSKWFAITALIALIALSRPLYFGTDMLCLAAFLLSLWMAPPAPTLSMASITERTPESESL